MGVQLKEMNSYIALLSITDKLSFDVYSDANMTGLDTLGEKIDNMEELFVGMQVQLKTTERIVDAATLQLSGTFLLALLLK